MGLAPLLACNSVRTNRTGKRSVLESPSTTRSRARGLSPVLSARDRGYPTRRPRRFTVNDVTAPDRTLAALEDADTRFARTTVGGSCEGRKQSSSAPASGAETDRPRTFPSRTVRCPACRVRSIPPTIRGVRERSEPTYRRPPTSVGHLEGSRDSPLSR